MSIRIVTDSNNDLPQEILEQHGIKVVPLYINVGTDSYLDGVDMSRAEFYEGLPHFARHPTTAVPGVQIFTSAYDTLVAEGATAIISVHISENLSGVMNVARMAGRDYEKVPVTVFDSGNLTLGTGLMALRAAKAAQGGQSAEEIVALLEDQRRRTYCFAALDTLEYLRRSGRLSRLQSRLGSLLRLKPILHMNDGEFEMLRVRTRQKALARVIELVDDLGPLEQIALVHTHDPAGASALQGRASHLFVDEPSPISAEVTPVIGTHIGPGAVGFVCIKARI